ncbi:MAG: sugar ABC transporter ATP-binding protein [Spirochaetaceae bacterium]|nr:MAG: sugar ABC transporter ATP-binding protein [Spirochaetaceae bacterium]
MVLELKNLRKTYPGTVAVTDLSVRFEGGKVHAIVGKNGSGKSTAIKMVAGAVMPDRGSISLDDRPLHLGSTFDAIHQGIATVYQELSLFPDLSVAENICFHELPHRGVRVDWAATRRRALDVLRELDLEVDPDTRVDSLSVGWQQLVEISKAINHDLKVLILDEPTSALSKDEVDQLFRVVRRIRDRGVIVLYISHRLQELPAIADTVTVLRDGDLVGRRTMTETTLAQIVSMMFGDVEHVRMTPTIPEQAEVALEVRNLTRKPWFEDISFSLRAGEILGIAGMLGSGRTELLRSIFGADSFDSGTVLVSGKPIRRPTPARLKLYGLAYTPENRKTQGLIQIQTVQENLTLAGKQSLSRRGVRNRTLERAAAMQQVNDLSIKISSLDTVVETLSGGNQQKVVVGNWLNDHPRVVLFDEPSRGIDVDAKQQIFRIIWRLSDDGIASIIVSTELEELLEVCHRILVLRDGTLQQEIVPGTVSVEALYNACIGVAQ